MERALVVLGTGLCGLLMFVGIMNENESTNTLLPAAVVIGAGFIALAIMEKKNE